ncbi:SIR2 family protein [Rhodococcoides fascians]|uniref:SIR2 family protein n=1 Tax=Rhodococcoides fascians TaxID=1828 RepID=UPI002ACDE603|nr:SIR2 family protein [Rhodococcus fascians]WQH27561.1 SIR2 family protein [Rhodococcus fascians]
MTTELTPDEKQPSSSTVRPDGCDDHLREALGASLASHNALPYLFVGSGLSRRYLNLPDWEGLLRTFADDVGADLDFMLATTRNDLPATASLLAKEFHPYWFSNKKFAKQRKDFKTTVRDDEGAFKVAVAQFFQERSKLASGTPGFDRPDYFNEIASLREAVIDGVITTNYDSLTDQIFPKFTSYVGQDDLILSDAQFIAETYKIHGSSADPRSLILTERDYAEFHDRNSYLAAKLLTIFAEHPVIFLGYSMHDKYIREIIASIAKAVGPDKLDALQKQIYFVEWNSNEAAESRLSPYFFEVIQGHSLPAQKIETHSFLPIFQALAGLNRPFPAHLLREFRKHVYELVTHPDPDQALESVRAVPFDSENADGLRVVFGIGMFTDKDLEDISSISGRTLTRDDLARDLLGIRSRGLDAKNVVEHGLPSILKYSANAYLPVFKYLRESQPTASKIDSSQYPTALGNLITRIPAPSAQNIARFKRTVEGRLFTPEQVFSDNSLALYFKFECLLCLNTEDYEMEELRTILAEQIDAPENSRSINRTHLFKAIAYYDRLRYSIPTT